jgi:hypothetical protein
MSSPILSMPLGRIHEAERQPTLEEIREQFVERPGIRASAARGALTGVLLGVGLWGAIIAGVVGILKQ